MLWYIIFSTDANLTDKTVIFYKDIFKRRIFDAIL